MSKEEIALELTKLAYTNATYENRLSNKNQKTEEVITNLYNYIFNNLDSEQSK